MHTAINAQLGVWPKATRMTAKVMASAIAADGGSRQPIRSAHGVRVSGLPQMRESRGAARD